MDKYRLLKTCESAGIKVDKYINGEHEMAYKVVDKFFTNWKFLKLKLHLQEFSIYYYVLFQNAHLLFEDRNPLLESICKQFLIEEIEPIFQFDHQQIRNCFTIDSKIDKQGVDKYIDFIKRIRDGRIELNEITLDNQYIALIQNELWRIYQREPSTANMSKFFMRPDFLNSIKVDKPIKSIYVDIAEYMFNKEKQEEYDNQNEERETEIWKTGILFDILTMLTQEDKSKVNEFILNNMTNVLDEETYIGVAYLGKIPQRISSILYDQQYGEYIDIKIQKKLLDFLVEQGAFKELHPEYCKQLQDYIFENHIWLLQNLYIHQLPEVLIRNSDNVNKLKDKDDIQTAIKLVENALNYQLEQYNNEADSCFCDKKKFNEILELISRRIYTEFPKTREFIQVMNKDDIINSVYLLDCYFKKEKCKNNRTIDRFNSLIKDDFVNMFETLKRKSILEKMYKKIKNLSLQVVYEDEMREMQKLVDEKYKSYVEEFHKSKRYSFDKYYAQVESNLNKETDFHTFVGNKNFSEIFNKIILTYNAKEIKDLLASNEYYYAQLQESAEGCELTPLMTCLIKAIEQIMCACVKYAYNRGWCSSDIISDKYEHKLDSINWEKTKITCTPLKIFIEDNILNNDNIYIDNRFKTKLIKSLENFIDNVRNGHFHKHNVFGIRNIKQYVKDAYYTISGLIATIIYLEENAKKY